MAGKKSASALDEHVGYWLRFVSNHVSQAFTRKIEARGVTVAEWVLLRAMLEAGATSPSQLAERMGMTRGAISKLIDRACEKQLVVRSAAGADRRFQSVALTAAGKKLVPVLARLADENDREFFGHWSAGQRTELIALLRELVRRHEWKDLPVQ